jgi:SWI/SNF-related matrix-associated actin-dependent regulator of chromatin subfamily A member 5
MKAVISAGWVDPPKRERKKNYNENEYYREVMVQAPRAIKATGKP